MADEQRLDTTSDLATDYLRDVERLRADLGPVLRQHARSKGWGFCVHAELEDVGANAAWFIEREPTARAPLVARLKELLLYIETIGQPTQ